MTREEAITRLNNIIKVVNQNTIEAIEMAIEVLWQEPCGDTISRQAVLDEINKVGVKGFETYNDYSQLYDFVDTLPSVTPKEKTGHWILQPSNKEQGERDFIWWKCSKCGQVIFSETKEDRQEYHAYCGRCGAKMEVSE